MTPIALTFSWQKGFWRLCGSPVVRRFLIVQMPDTSNERMVPLFLCPHDGFMLRFEGGQHVIRMILYDIIVDVRAVFPSLWPGLNVNATSASRITLLSCVVRSAWPAFSWPTDAGLKPQARTWPHRQQAPLLHSAAAHP